MANCIRPGMLPYPLAFEYWKYIRHPTRLIWGTHHQLNPFPKKGTKVPIMRLSADNGQCVWPLDHEACDWCEGVKCFYSSFCFYSLVSGISSVHCGRWAIVRSVSVFRSCVGFRLEYPVGWFDKRNRRFVRLSSLGLLSLCRIPRDLRSVGILLLHLIGYEHHRNED